MTNETPILNQEDTDSEDIQKLSGTGEDENLDAGLDAKETDGTADEIKSKDTGDETKENPVDPAVQSILDQKDKEIVSLRGMVRQLDRDFRGYKEDNVNKPQPEESDEFTDLDEEDKKPEIDVDTIYEKNREIQLETYLETMRMSSKYEDVDDVIALNHFDDTVEMLANAWMEKNPDNDATRSDVIAGVEKQIWSQKNPYRYMYDVIKETHPTYSKGIKTVNPLKKEDIVPSVNNMDGAKKTSMAGWTSARIDALPESELGTVPRDVYSTYMKGELK